MSRNRLNPPSAPASVSTSRAPSHNSQHSRLMNPDGPSHAHPQHDNFVGGSALGPSMTDAVVAEQNDLIEDNLEDQSESSSPSLITNGKGGVRRRPSVTWMDQTDENGVAKPLLQERSADGRVDDDYDAREGSIARRSAWRKPSPMKLLPAFSILAVCMGMGAAPKQELFINLACLAHPPQTQSVYPSNPGFSASTIARSLFLPGSSPSSRSSVNHDTTWVHVPSFNFSSVSNGVIVQPAILPPFSPADKWMLDVQRRIAAEEKRKREIESHRSSPSTSDLPSPTSKAAPLPQPTGPIADLPGKPDGKDRESKPEKPVETNDPWDDDEMDDEEWDRAHPNEVKPGEIDPRLCKKSPETQAAAARLSMIMTLSMGLLSALTTGFWGSLSDRYGRTRVMTVAILGLVWSDIVLIITASYPNHVPGGYRFLILGPVVDGMLGGWSTIQATINAYLSDSTPDGSRAKTFSRFVGILMIGFALGPMVGSAVIKFTGQLMIVFYIAAVANAAFASYVFFILPESLSSEARAALAKAADAKALRRQQKEQAEREWENESEEEEEEDAGQSSLSVAGPVGGDSGWSRLSTRTTGTNASHRAKRGKKFRGRLRRFRRRTLAFLAPLAMFLPRPKRSGGPSKDWNLTFLAMGAFCLAMMAGLIQIKTQFVIFMYGWTSVELGPYMSLLGAVRASMLLVLFPILSTALKPKVSTAPAPPTLSEAGPDTPPATGPGIYRSEQTLTDAKFDLKVLRISLMVECVGYALLSFVIPAPAFVLGSTFVALGAAAGPSMNSLALTLIDSSREAGKLFGGLSVVNALSQTFLGPLIFSLTFANTISFYAPMIFVVASSVFFLSFIFFSMVRLPKTRSQRKPERERGRKRRVKRVNSSAEVAPLLQGGGS